MTTALRFISFSLLFLFVTSSAYAETRYISDQLLVTVRSGEGDQYRILETLPTSTPVKILEENKNYVKVITPKGTEGYILSHYVSKNLPKSVQIGQLNQEIAKLQQQLSSQQQKFQTSQDEASSHKNTIAELSSQLDQTHQELEKIKGDYKTLLSNSENIIGLSSENERLVEEGKLQNSELMVLREENQNFHRSNMIQWFLAGGAVFFGGWLIGKISRKKQRRF